MAVSKVGTLLVVIIALAGISLPSNCVVAAKECRVKLDALISQCAKFIQIPGPPVEPSELCCEVIQDADMPCLCTMITKEIEKFLSVKKIAYIANSCKRPFKSGAKCGSKQVISDFLISLDH
ncbi:protease inhibitor/seed storage/lipid transfer family protein [Cinnamomum micranthum f. kanehirae]|uniref:Protease inhibitor/seed storage/lipid transfer family protein n=1 Tax=Cinnamomum micranthum f. kanehirae TaxID=337451 RepID=A0A3S3NUU1_9MAGN|nr:protease inhibitor/seed storage/lipid transfer family protein [Cinnamomum micranthum f. kanehirae]